MLGSAHTSGEPRNLAAPPLIGRLFVQRANPGTANKPLDELEHRLADAAALVAPIMVATGVTRHQALQAKATESSAMHDTVIAGVLVRLLVGAPSERQAQLEEITLIATDDLASVCRTLQQLAATKYHKLTDGVRQSLLWLLAELVRLVVPRIQEVNLLLLRHLGSGTCPDELWLAGELVQLSHTQLPWLLSHGRLLTMSFLCFARLATNHCRGAEPISQLVAREAELCTAIFKARPAECCSIGRDCAVVLQRAAAAHSVPGFRALWSAVRSAKTAEKTALISQMIGRPTHLKYLEWQIPVIAAQQLEFLLWRLPANCAHRHQFWFSERWLQPASARGAMTCAMIRFVCRIEVPVGLNINSLSARCQILYWLLEQLPERSRPEGLTALLTDWVFHGTTSDDLIASAEPAVKLVADGLAGWHPDASIQSASSAANPTQSGRWALALIMRVCELAMSDTAKVRESLLQVLRSLPQYCAALDRCRGSSHVPRQVQNQFLWLTSPDIPKPPEHDDEPPPPPPEELSAPVRRCPQVPPFLTLYMRDIVIPTKLDQLAALCPSLLEAYVNAVKAETGSEAASKGIIDPVSALLDPSAAIDDGAVPTGVTKLEQNKNQMAAFLDGLLEAPTQLLAPVTEMLDCVIRICNSSRDGELVAKRARKEGAHSLLLLIVALAAHEGWRCLPGQLLHRLLVGGHPVGPLDGWAGGPLDLFIQSIEAQAAEPDAALQPEELLAAQLVEWTSWGEFDTFFQAVSGMCRDAPQWTVGNSAVVQQVLRMNSACVLSMCMHRCCAQ